MQKRNKRRNPSLATFSHRGMSKNKQFMAAYKVQQFQSQKGLIYEKLKLF